MRAESWQVLLVGALAFNAVVGFGYRVFRLSKGGAMGDVVGQALLGVVLAALALAIALDVEWARWPALAYGITFGLIVMPVWVLAVLLPLPPAGTDYAFTAIYWLALVVIVVAALAA